MKLKWFFVILICVISTVQAQVFRISPMSLNFGYTEIGQTTTLEITIENLNDNFYPRVMVFTQDRSNFKLSWTGQRLEAVKAMNAIRHIETAIHFFLQDFGVEAEVPSFEELVEFEYIIPDSTFESWNFRLIGSSPPSEIEALSNENMPYGADQSIQFDLQAGKFSGFAVPFHDPQRPLHAQEFLGHLWNAVRMYRQDYHEDPFSVEQLLELEYAYFYREYVSHDFDFELIFVDNTLVELRATATQNFEQPGAIISFNISTGEFSGYRLPYEEFYDWLYIQSGHGTLTLQVDFHPTEQGWIGSELMITIYDVGEEDINVRVPLSGNGVSSAPKEMSQIPSQFAIQSVYPNPFNALASINISLFKSETIMLYLIDITGSAIKEIYTGTLTAGSNSLLFDASDLTNGIYFIKLVTNEKSSIARTVLLR